MSYERIQQVIKVGGSLVVVLTYPLKTLGLHENKNVKVVLSKNQIIIEKCESEDDAKS